MMGGRSFAPSCCIRKLPQKGYKIHSAIIVRMIVKGFGLRQRQPLGGLCSFPYPQSRSG
jgi:hypothetical protein